jgi:hypothetical protein
MLTPAEVAELAKVSRKTVYREIDRGELRALNVTNEPLDPEYNALRSRERDRIYDLLTSPTETDTSKSSRRRISLYERELRRECDRLRLELALEGI